MIIRDANNELIEWLNYHHHPMHEAGGVDAIDLTGLSMDYLHITSEVAQAFKAEYNITSQLGAYVHGVKVELTRAADIQPSTGCWFGGQFVLNIGTGYADLDKPAYAIQGIIKGDAASPNGVDIHAGRFETQSGGKVSDIVHILANTGTTIVGSLEYIAAHVAPSLAMLNINAQSSITVPIGINIMSGVGSSYNYGLDLNGAVINTADIRFHHGTTLLDDGTLLTLAGANLNINGNYIVNVRQLRGCDGHHLNIYANYLATAVTEKDIIFWTLNSGTDTWVEVFRCDANGATPVLKLAKGLNANGNAITNHPQAITDNALVTIDGADIADDEFARFTANGLESRSITEVLTDLGVTALAAELNLLDLAGMPTGALLMATGAASAVWSSQANVLAELSGEAGAAFDWNSQNLSGVGTLNAHTIPGGTDTFAMLAATQVLTNKTLTSPAINGTISTTGLTMPTFILPTGKGITDTDGDTKIQVEESGDEDKIRMDVGGTEAFLLSDIGVLTLAKQSSGLAYRGTSIQWLQTLIWNKVCLNAEDWDVQNEFDTALLTGTDDRANGEGADHLIDDGNAQFSSGDVGKTVWNTTDNTYATVTAHSDAGDLTLSAAIFTNGEGYVLYFSRFTVTEAGKYLLVGLGYIQTFADGDVFQIAFYKNGALLSGNFTIAPSATDLRCEHIDEVELAASDYIELYAKQSNAAVKNLYFGRVYTWLSVTKLA